MCFSRNFLQDIFDLSAPVTKFPGFSSNRKPSRTRVFRRRSKSQEAEPRLVICKTDETLYRVTDWLHVNCDESLFLKSDSFIWRIFVSIDYYNTKFFHFSFITSKRIYHENFTSFPALEFLWKQLPLPRLSWYIQGKQDVTNINIGCQLHHITLNSLH